MCEQTEIHYLDGDVVWVKLGSYWWPGQVVGIEKLPEDIQSEFKRKPLIAAVKFFQEDSFEFVKNYQQIYKYNCTQKEDFIRKGLDKYRIKSKDGSNYMDKFPEDVKTAEILTDGDPDILLNEKFNPEEKPDISGLFGEKKTLKKKRNRDDFIKKSDSDIQQQVTHHRFLKENDHEVRIRQQPKNLPSTSSNFQAGIYPCHICGFTATRVNIIICHLKNHRLNKETEITTKLKVKANTSTKSKQNNLESPKRKYIRKSLSRKINTDNSIEFRKRKYYKQVEKSNKKKKSDPELREKLLADWNVDTDEDEPIYIEKSINIKSIDLPSKNQSCLKNIDETNILKTETSKNHSDSILFLQASDKLLQETDNFTNLSILKNIPCNLNQVDADQNNVEKLNTVLLLSKSKESFNFKKATIENSLLKEKDDKKSKLSCFDFDEDDVPEPSISSVRKIPRSLGSKNISIKKEIIKEFEMSQALKNDEGKFFKNDEICIANLKINKQFTIAEEKIQINKDVEDNRDIEVTVKKENEKYQNSHQNNEKFGKSIEICETHLEIVEIFEVEKEDEEKIVKKNEIETEVENEYVGKLKSQEDLVIKSKNEEIIKDIETQEKIEKEVSKKILQNKKLELDLFTENKRNEIKKNEFKEIDLFKNSQHLINDDISNNIPIVEAKQSLHTSESQEIMYEKFTIEVKDKTNLSVDSIFSKENNSNIEVLSNFKSTSQGLSNNEDNTTKDYLNFTVKKRRGRPRKNLTSVEDISSDEHLKSDELKKKIESDQKILELDLDYSYSPRVRRRKPNRRYQSPLYLQKFDSGSSKTDENLSESDDKKEETKDKRKIDRKLAKSKTNIKLIDKIQDWKSSINIMDNINSIGVNIKKNTIANDSEIKELIKEHNNILVTKDLLEQSKYNNLKEEENIEEDKKVTVQENSDVEILYPKKCQIKKFELSKIDFTDNNSVKYLNMDLNDHLYKIFGEKKNIKEDLKKETDNIQNEMSSRISKNSEITHVLNKEINTEKLEKVNFKKVKMEDKLLLTKSTSAIEKSNNLYEIDDIEKHVSDMSFKLKKGKLDDNQFDSFQDAFIKTLQIDNSLRKENVSEIQKSEKKNIDLNDMKKEPVIEADTVQNLSEKPVIANFSVIDNCDSIEVVLTGNKVEKKPEERVSFISNKNVIQPSINSALSIESSNLIVSEKPVIQSNENLNKLNNSENSKLMTSSELGLKLSVPVKKREKPRIIENVALKEPMILNTKLMEKYIGKVGKHKLESDNFVTDDLTKFSKTKIMKMETVISNSKNRSHTISDNLTMTKKIVKTLKSEDDSLITDSRNRQTIAALPKTLSEVLRAEKYIQQSSQSLVDMDLDINSMPFVLSEDVLTPESIEQMPVVISSILPTKIPITTPLSTTLVTPTKQVLSVNQLFDSSREINEICQKKKSGTPTILKNKSKTKPTITSIKTIVPPLTSTAHKGNYKGNTQALKTSLGNQKTAGKYVIVQTSGHQQAYSTHHKVAIPTSKGSGNAQIVQQGNKVVILTSPQSGQSGQKIIPLNSISKALNSGKVQRIITSKHGQKVCKPVSPQNFVGSTTILTSSGDFNAPTISKMASQKILGQQQIITSKSVLTQLPGTIAKSNILGGIPQGILTKDGIFTPINASLGGKTIISSKTLITKGFPHQSASISKSTSSPMNQSPSKTIISSQGIVSKGTILTPITGSQVKALAAKNIKGNKLQSQLDQQKVQLAGAPKSQKVPISSSLVQGNTNFKTSSSLMVLQKTEFKTTTPNKNDIKQSIQKQLSATTVLPSATVMTIQPKSKMAFTGLEQKIIGSKNINYSVKMQQNLIIDKTEEMFKSSTNNETSSLKTKIVEQQRQLLSEPILKHNKSVNKNLHKKVSNVANSTIPSHSNVHTSFSVTVPLETINIPKKQQILEQISSKKETNTEYIDGEKIIEPKITAQPQIMALPTENSDGTQTYILVTVDEQGHIIPLDNNALMSLEGTSNLDGSRTLYIDSSSLNESGSIDNIVLQINNNSMSNIHTTNVSESTLAAVTETLSSSEVALPTNQDILAAALANTDFQHEIGVVECSSSTAMTSLTQTSLINQTILQSTIIPPTEPISSPLVLETSLTLNQPIMTPLEVPSTLTIQPDLTPIISTAMVPTPIELPITDANQSISYIAMKTEDPLLQISDNSKLQIKESIENIPLKNTVDIKISTNPQCTIETNLDESIIHRNPETESQSISDVSYSYLSISKNDVDKKQIQTTPSMPIIDDTFNANNGFDSTNTSVTIEDNLKNYVTKTSEELIHDLTGNDLLQENNECSENVSNNKTCSIQEIISESPKIIFDDTQDDCDSSQQSRNLTTHQSKENITSNHMASLKEITKTLNTDNYINEEAYVVSSESSDKLQSYVVASKESKATLVVQKSTVTQKEEYLKLNKELPSKCQFESPSSKTKSLETAINKEKMTECRDKNINDSQTSDLSLQGEFNQDSVKVYKRTFITEKNEIEEVPSQSYEQFVSATSDIVEVPSQSAKSESSEVTTQALSYESMKTNKCILVGEPPTPSYEVSKLNVTSQCHKSLRDINIDVPTQSFNEMMEVNENKTEITNSVDDPNFPTQSYEVEKVEDLIGNMETETDVCHGANSPTQSNDVSVDGIGTSSLSTNNLALNEDETASSSYVPETPENQERDQDQESAISTSSYEIPPCEELNIASTSVIPDTSVQSEHSSILNNGVPEIPSSSYNLNPDSSSTQVDTVQTSSYEDQIIVEQNVSTSYDVPISIGNLQESSSQSYVTNSSDERSEATSYYPHNEEVTESYYESICKQSNSRLETNSEEEATPSFYESNPIHITSEASQSYFNQEEATTSYSNHISPSYFDPRGEGEASQSYYSAQELNRSTQSVLQNVEATQSFYQENSDGQQLHQQGEATPTYTDRYSLDYVPVNSVLDRHDLVESSVPVKSMDR